MPKGKPKKPRPVTPLVIRKPIYEMRGQVRLRITCQDEEAASVWHLRLLGLAVKLADFVERRFGMEIAVEWDDAPEHVATHFRRVA